MSADGFVVWFTGLSGAGKSTLATLLAAELMARDVHVEVLDGDEVRAHLSRGLGFSREDRDTNVRRVGFVAKLLARSGACAITAAISPYRVTRDEQRASIGRFVEVFCKCSVDALADRDPKGLYKKALAGEIKNFTGVSDPYEEPLDPEVTVDTGNSTVDECLATIISRLHELGYLEEQTGERLTPAWGGPIVAARPRSAAGPSVATVAIDAGAAAMCEAVRSGLLSPLRGPMAEKDATKFRKEDRLESGVAWPLAWVLPLPEQKTWEKGEVVDLVGPNAVTYALEVGEVWQDADGRSHLSGELLTDPPRRAVAIRRDLAAAELEDAAALLLRTELTPEIELLLAVGLEARGKVVLFASDDADIIRSARAFIARRGLAAVARLIPIPTLPVLDAHKDPLLNVVALRNLGAGAAIIDAPHGPSAPGPRDVLSELRDVEVGIELVAAGPVTRLADGSLATRRMGILNRS